jgi:hypothetical protein
MNDERYPVRGALCRAVVSISDGEDALTLHIKLPVDDRSIMIHYPKPDGAHPGRPWTTFMTGNIDYVLDDGDMSFDEFEDWVKIAVGMMPRHRERRWLCQICGDKEGFGPMLRDEVWKKIAPNPRGLMCLPCMQAKAKEKGVSLR